MICFGKEKLVTFELGYEEEIDGVYLVMSVSFHFLFKGR